MEKLIMELKRRGHQVAAAKHAKHALQFDHPGKDSWKLFQAGADTVLISAGDKVVTIEPVKKEPSLAELAQRVNCDILLAEGFRGESMPKIEIHRAGFGDLLCPLDGLVAIVTDEPMNIPLNQYSHNDIAGLADFIEQKFLAVRNEDDS